MSIKGKSKVVRKPLEAGKVVKGGGFDEDMNFRYRKTMEDGHLFVDGIGKDGNHMLACVFDGHGGVDTVRYLEKNFQKVFEKNLQKDQPMEEILRSTFREVDNGLKHIQYNGATAAVVVIIKEGTTRHIYSANCGDARVVLVKKDGSGSRLSKDHKVTVPEEIERIQNAGGWITTGRVNGVLAVSRAFGDHGLKHLVVSTPYINTVDITEDDVRLIVACDGVWDVLTDDEAAACVLKAGSSPQDAATALKDLALKKNTMDNVTAMVVEL